jgi:hypothetical protein
MALGRSSGKTLRRHSARFTSLSSYATKTYSSSAQQASQARRPRNPEGSFGSADLLAVSREATNRSYQEVSHPPGPGRVLHGRSSPSRVRAPGPARAPPPGSRAVRGSGAVPAGPARHPRCYGRSAAHAQVRGAMAGPGCHAQVRGTAQSPAGTTATACGVPRIRPAPRAARRAAAGRHRIHEFKNT